MFSKDFINIADDSGKNLGRNFETYINKYEIPRGLGVGNTNQQWHNDYRKAVGHSFYITFEEKFTKPYVIGILDIQMMH